MQAERSKINNGYKYKHQFIGRYVDYRNRNVCLIIDRVHKVLYYNKSCYTKANLVILI